MTPTAVRTEVEVSADTLYRLFICGLIVVDDMPRAMNELGLGRDDIANAQVRHQNGRYRPARQAPLLPTIGPGPKPFSPVTAPDAANQGHGPPVDERFCRRCELFKALADFGPRSRVCRECVNRERRMRYLSIEREAVINRCTLRFAIANADPLIRCGDCGEELLTYDQVKVCDVVVCHEACHPPDA